MFDFFFFGGKRCCAFRRTVIKRAKYPQEIQKQLKHQKIHGGSQQRTKPEKRPLIANTKAINAPQNTTKATNLQHRTPTEKNPQTEVKQSLKPQPTNKNR